MIEDPREQSQEDYEKKEVKKADPEAARRRRGSRLWSLVLRDRFASGLHLFLVAQRISADEICYHNA
jgi:hypothetical protein